MFPTGSTGGQDEPGPTSPTDEQKDQRLHRKLQEHPLEPEDSLHSLPPVETKPEQNEDGVGDGGRDEDDDEGSSNAVEHILKELKGINKIQEEISDLRRYLTSVRGSVDQVSSCVDTVLSEIGEFYSGASASPLPAPLSQTPNIRRGSLGRQNAVTSSPSDGSARGRHVFRVHRHPDQQTGNEECKQEAGAAKVDLCYVKLHGRHDYQSTSSLSSCLSPEAAFGPEDSDRWASAGERKSVSQEGGWSEQEDECDSLRTGPGRWDRLAAEEMESSTPGHSSHNSSEHLALLHYDSPSSWRHQRAESKESKPACRCPVDCPYWSSGAHTVDLCLNEPGSGPSWSPKRSTVQVTDCDDGYLEPSCDDPSPGDTPDLGSTDSLDRDWTDCSVSGDEAGGTLSRESSLMDLHCTEIPSTSCDFPTFSQAVLTFRSALKVALRKLEGSNPEDDAAEEEPHCADGDLVGEARGTESNGPKEDCEALVLTAAPEKLSSSCPTSPLNSPHSPTQSHFVGLPGEQAACAALVEPSSKKAAPGRWTEGQAESPQGPGPGPEEARLSPIRENQGVDEVSRARPADPGHRERIANFQRILREKRRARLRLSRSVPGSQSSQGSQWSQGSQSQDEVVPGTFRLLMG